MPCSGFVSVNEPAISINPLTKSTVKKPRANTILPCSKGPLAARKASFNLLDGMPLIHADKNTVPTKLGRTTRQPEDETIGVGKILYENMDRS
jgi:hypothetical protein